MSSDLGRKRFGWGVLLTLAAAAIGCFPATADEPSSTGLRSVVQTELAPGNGEWAVMADSTLKGTLRGWATAAGWRVVWDHEGDYRLRASVTFDGTFEDAVLRLVDAVYRSYPELAVDLYRGNATVHVYTLAPATR